MSKYKDTVNLPETAFAMRGDLAKREPEILAHWHATRLYERIQAERAGAPLWVLHDGPPYSNGHIHYGHILNKLLKDIIVKSRTMAGFRTPYIPGWDTHGLPIEKAVIDKNLRDKRDVSPAELREQCRAYALEYVDIQRREFQRLGVFGDWEHPYLTLDPVYEATIARALATFARGGYLYRGKKPVVWCPQDKTALAEAEIEYKDHESPSVYVRFPLEGQKASFVIWTTTPWTLPANLAIVAHPQFEYVAIPHGGEELIVAKSLAEAFGKATGIDVSGAQPIKLAEGTRYTHPFVPRQHDNEHRLWFADYVTADTGTGLVHTAPGHGADDYKTGQAHGLPPYAPLDDSARYTEGVPLGLTGKTTDEANPIVVEWLAANGFLLNPKTDRLRHQYPHCWRCKNPIVFRATPQWFVAMDHADLRGKALKAIDETNWVPPWGHDRIYAMIANRPDWVLSRQRYWGTPIPVFYCAACGTEHASADTMDFVAAIFAKDGADAWWRRPASELVPPGTKCGKCGAGADKLEKEKDIVDVWFESGVSWLVMAERDADHRHIDLYLEGSDQHRGWFHSSLLVGIAVAGRAPYDQVITHGFVLDDNGKEYSKSAIAKAKAEGRKIDYIEPDSVIAKNGAELFRLWVGSIEFRGDMTYSQAILDGLSEWYRKLRNTARFLLGNLKGFDPNAPEVRDRSIVTLAVDRYMLAKLDELVARARKAYEQYELHVVHRLLVDFVTVDVSAFYGDVTKDRLYSDAASSRARRAAQLVMYECARAIATLAAPILAFTAEDIWAHLPRRAGDPDSVHLATFPEPRIPEPVPELDIALAWRARVTKELEPFRAEKRKSVDAQVTLRASAADRAALDKVRDELADIFIVSAVAIEAGDGTVAVALHPGPRCERCWKHYERLAADPPDVCERCSQALRAKS
ncbi:MAG TPA: isoleucine--tRNA ligase [Kofleriaceae bacterium]|nr:isoleucine--tRNA ligase [Kofleriaceae bacterium]